MLQHLKQKMVYWQCTVVESDSGGKGIRGCSNLWIFFFFLPEFQCASNHLEN